MRMTDEVKNIVAQLSQTLCEEIVKDVPGTRGKLLRVQAAADRIAGWVLVIG